MLNFIEAVRMMHEKLCSKCQEPNCRLCPWSIEAALKEVERKEE